MNENNNNIQKHQEEKLQIEIELLKAEKAKMDLEKLRLEKEINKPWYKKERYLQAFFAGIVAVPLLWFFFKDVALPIYQKENVKLEYENELAKIRNEQQKDSLFLLKSQIAINDSLAKLEREKAWDDFDLKIAEYEKNKKLLINQYEEIIADLENGNESTQSVKSNEVQNLRTQLSNISTGQAKKYDADISIRDDYILQGEGVEYMETSNHSSFFEKGYPDAIVFQYTASENLESSASWMQNSEARTSVHVLIGRDGKIIQLVPFNVKAWHAGKSEYGGRSGYNNYSVGIGFINVGILEKKDNSYRSWTGKNYSADEVVRLTHKNETEPRYWQPYTEAQINRAEQICKLLVNLFSIKEIVGRDDLAPGRKSDPGPAFPLEKFQNDFL